MKKINLQQHVLATQYLSNNSAQAYLMPSHHLTRLAKQQILTPEIIQADQLLKKYLAQNNSVRQSSALAKYLDKIKLSEYEKVQIYNNNLKNEAEILLVLPSLDRFESKQIGEIIKLKNI